MCTRALKNIQLWGQGRSHDRPDKCVMLSALPGFRCMQMRANKGDSKKKTRRRLARYKNPFDRNCAGIVNATPHL